VKTRDKIAKAALALFNERGEAHVSLAQIAARLGISEGNLWYHFRTKRDLVAALFAELEARIDHALSRDPASFGPLLADFADHARQRYRDIWEYRFLYRHRFDPDEESELALRIAALIERAHRHTERVLAAWTDCVGPNGCIHVDEDPSALARKLVVRALMGLGVPRKAALDGLVRKAQEARKAPGRARRS